MRYLSLGEVVELHQALLNQTGGATDGNKRVAHAAMEVFLLLNGVELVADVDEQERLMLDLADGQVPREDLAAWLEKHVKPAPFGSEAV